MCSPMPDHFPIPINANGDGPASPEDTARFVCWCGDANCVEEPARENR